MDSINRKIRRTLAGSRIRSCFAFCCAIAFLLAASLAQTVRNHDRQSISLNQFDRAEQLRTALEQEPEAQRTRLEYERVLNAYRAVYHGDPASAKADDSIVTVAGLLAEQGRLFHSEKSLRDTIADYEFLRQQYPGSRYRFAALIAEGTIYRNDLADREQAKSKFEEFLATYPKHPMAAEARAQLISIRNEEALTAKGVDRPDREVAQITQPASHRMSGHPDQLESSPEETDKNTGSEKSLEEASARTNVESDMPPSRESPNPQTKQFAAPGGPVTAEDSVEAPPSHNGHESLVTGIRYWTTPQYTRIAVDLEDQVAYSTARVPNPDRVYFDLRDTHLARKLLGKSIPVADDGFLKRIRAAQYSDHVTRIVLDLDTSADYTAFFLPNPWRLIIDIRTRKSAPLAEAENHLPVPGKPLAGPAKASTTTAKKDVDKPAPPPVVQPAAAPAKEIASLPRLPHSVPSEGGQETAGVAPVQRPGTLKKPSPLHRASTDSGESAPSAVAVIPEQDGPSATGETELPPSREAERERSLARTLGLKVGRIVIDPGHGGHDCGTLGPRGIQEKEIVLDVAIRLGRLLKQRLGADVIYTRDDDTFIPLQRRTEIANQARADLFISIHANSSSDPAARGVESYYLNFTTSPDALEVAARENSVSNESIFELSDLVKQITLKDKIEESREFALDVQRALYGGLEAGNPGLKDRGVKKAPFVVLIGANMPSILAEISFLTNPSDARELRQPAYRQRIAESLYRGIARYTNGLNGVRLAENTGVN